MVRLLWCYLFLCGVTSRLNDNESSSLEDLSGFKYDEMLLCLNFITDGLSSDLAAVSSLE